MVGRLARAVSGFDDEPTVRMRSAGVIARRKVRIHIARRGAAIASAGCLTASIERDSGSQRARPTDAGTWIGSPGTARYQRR